MKTKVTILTFLIYTVVSGHEEEVDDTSRLATLGVSRRFGWFHRLGSPFAAPADTSVEVVNQSRAATKNETHHPLRGHIILPSEQADKRLAMTTNTQDEDVEEIPSRYLHTQSRNRNRNRNRARKNNAATRARARARARRRRRRRRNRNRRNRNRLFTDKSYVKETNRLFVRESTQQQQSSTEQVEVTENLGGCSGAEGSICAIFYPGAPPAPPSTSSPPEIPDLPDEFPEQQNKALVPPDDPTELPTAPTFEWIKLDERQHRAYDYFGYCVAIDENTIVVGAPSDADQAWLNTGFASVFYRGNDGWELQQDLQPPIEVGPGDFFGYSVAIHGNVIVVGAPLANLAQVYTRPEPGEMFAKAGPPLESHKIGRFGESVAIFGDKILVGAPHENHSGRSNAGSVYVFARFGNVWEYEAELIAQSPQSEEYFGTCVALYHDAAIVGMPGHGSLEKGGLQIFEYDGVDWMYDGPNFGDPIATSGSTSVFTGARYGAYCDIHKEFLIVGGDLVAPKVYEQTFTGDWGALGHSSLTTSNDDPVHGTAVAVDHDQGNDEDVLAVGGYDEVKIFYHEDNKWVHKDDAAGVPLAPDDVVNGDAFGASVDMSEGTVVAGAPLAHAGGLSPVGDVYVMDLNVDMN